MSSEKGINRRHVGGLDLLEIKGDPSRGTIVLFHGFGSDPYDLVPLAQTYEGPTWIFPQGPLEIQFAQGFTGRAWFPVNLEWINRATQDKRFDEVARGFPLDLKEARTTIENFLVDLEIPRSQILLGGFSQGAILAVDATLHSPFKCGGLLIFSGTLIHEKEWNRLAPQHSGTPFFQSHGTHDPILPLPNAQALASLLQEHGLKGELHTFSGGHDIPPPILKKLTAFLHHLL